MIVNKEVRSWQVDKTLLMRFTLSTYKLVNFSTYFLFLYLSILMQEPTEISNIIYERRVFYATGPEGSAAGV
jgi:hypothetical protein